MTSDETTSAVAALDRAAVAVAEAKTIVSTVKPTPPPAEPRRVPENFAAIGEAGAVRLTWTIPAALSGLAVFVAWGAGVYLGKAVLPPGTTSTTVRGLQPGTTYAFDTGLFGPPDGDVTDLTRTTATPLPSTPAPAPPVPDPPTLYPATADADAKVAFIRGNAGVGTAPLTRVASQKDLADHGLPGSWSGSQWNLTKGGLYQGLDVQGLIYYSGPEPLSLTAVRAQGVRYAQSAGKQGGTFRRCTMVKQPGSPLGRGAINFWGQSGWTIDRCDLSGAADGVQASGNGAINDSWIHDLAYGYSPEQGGPTHNDGIQLYSGLAQVDRLVVDMGGRAGSTNGALFCSEPTAYFVANDLFATVDVPDGNILHAHKSPKGITVNSGRLVGGRIISPLNNVKLGPSVLRVP